MLEHLPRRFRNEIIDQAVASTLGTTPFFQSIDADCRAHFATMLRPVALHAGEYVFKALESGMEMYFIVAGEVEIWDVDEKLILGKLTRGDFFGEIALFEDAFPCRTSSIRARTDVDPPPPPSSHTNRTRRVPHPVLIGHAASLSQVELLELRREDFHTEIRPFFPDVYQAWGGGGGRGGGGGGAGGGLGPGGWGVLFAARIALRAMEQREVDMALMWASMNDTSKDISRVIAVSRIACRSPSRQRRRRGPRRAESRPRRGGMALALRARARARVREEGRW